VIKNITLEEWEAEQMKDPEFRSALEDLEPAYQVARLRMEKGLTQAQLAELVGTKQSSIARLESGASQPRLSFLRRVIKALNGQMNIEIVSESEVVTKEVKARDVKAPIQYVWINTAKFSEQDKGKSYAGILTNTISNNIFQEDLSQ
jgi:transcriptional regulator with XRE-family HTH domain